MVQITGHDLLKAKGVTLVAGSAPTFFMEDTPTAVLVRQVLGAQTSLGQAMMYSHGFGSDESKTAFARARVLAAGAGDASERFDAYYGLYVSSLMRGELSLGRGKPRRASCATPKTRGARRRRRPHAAMWAWRASPRAISSAQKRISPRR
jgi:hypothetical protein